MIKILVIEDERVLRKSLLKMLSAEGYQSIGAENGSIGVYLARTQKPDLILCDLMMPELDGYGVVSILQEDTNTAMIPVICLTAKEDRAALRQVMELGADDYINKPFSRAELFGAITAQLEKRKRAQKQTEALKQVIAKLNYSVHFDPVTNLPNRLLLRERFQKMVQTESSQGSKIPCLVLCIHQLERISNSLRENYGQQLFRAIAERLKSAVNEPGIVAQLSVDQFAIILPPVGAQGNLAQEKSQGLAERLLGLLAQPFAFGKHEIVLTNCIGIAMYPDDGVEIDNLLKKATMAMDQDKQRQRSSCQIYTPAIQVKSKDRLMLEMSLRQAIENEQFQVYYQPIIDLDSDKIIAVEALVRWQHPERGLVTPDEFIPLAEETGLILSVDEWVMRTACKQVKQWQNTGVDLSVAINISGLHFSQTNLGRRVLQILETTQLDPQFLELELTESALVQNPENASLVLKRLKTIGVRLGLDDFGTGYSSLSYLQQFPFDTIKVDRSFVQNLEQNSKNAAIVTAIIQMAHSLTLKVVAEGVETEAEQNFLRDHDCDYFQGYWYSHPIPAEVLTQRLQLNQQILS
jgi:diguanylate cyclase (GGDEF)-like protein